MGTTFPHWLFGLKSEFNYSGEIASLASCLADCLLLWFVHKSSFKTSGLLLLAKWNIAWQESTKRHGFMWFCKWFNDGYSQTCFFLNWNGMGSARVLVWCCNIATKQWSQTLLLEIQPLNLTQPFYTQKMIRDLKVVNIRLLFQPTTHLDKVIRDWRMEIKLDRLVVFGGCIEYPRSKQLTFLYKQRKTQKKLPTRPHHRLNF